MYNRWAEARTIAALGVEVMTHIRRHSQLLMGIGFLWLGLWSVAGSLLGAKINSSAASIDPSWLGTWERTLLRTAHAHMNAMGTTVILMGLSLPKLPSHLFRFPTLWAVRCALLGVPLFGAGLLAESVSPPQVGAMPWAQSLTALGGILYMVSLFFWAASLLLSSRSE